MWPCRRAVWGVFPAGLPVGAWAFALLVGELAAWNRAAVAGEPCHYTWVQIPNPPGTSCKGQAINNHGMVTGDVYFGAADNTRVFVWSEETGTAILPLPPNIISMTARGINDAGHVAGTMEGALGFGYFGFLWDGAEYTMFSPPAWANMIHVSGMNNAGEIVGTVLHNTFGPNLPFVWSDGAMTVLGGPAGSYATLATAINEFGAVAGWGSDAQGASHGLVIHDLYWPHWLNEPETARWSSVAAINNNSILVGRAFENSGGSRAIVWTHSQEYMVASPGTNFDAGFVSVNDSGRAVGYTHNGSAAIAWQHGTVTALGPLLVPRPRLPPGAALAINRIGQIVTGYSPGSLVLTPNWLPGDLTGDCHVALEDLALLLQNFGLPLGSYPIGDANADGRVDLEDLTIVLAHYGQ